MKSTIWKFPLTTTDEQVIDIPAGAEFLSVQVQHGRPCIWAKVNLQENIIIRIKVVIIGTGKPANASENMQFVGTYQLDDGNFVGHVFVGAT